MFKPGRFFSRDGSDYCGNLGNGGSGGPSMPKKLPARTQKAWVLEESQPLTGRDRAVGKIASDDSLSARPPVIGNVYYRALVTLYLH